MDIIDLTDKPENGEFISRLRDTCSDLGIDYASYVSSNTVTGTVHTFTTYPESWKSHYIEHKLHEIDPTINSAMRSISPVDWKRLESHEGFFDVFSQAQDFNVSRAGVTVPIRGPYGELGLFCAASSLKQGDWEKHRTEIIAELQLAAVYTHDWVMNSDRLMLSLRYPSLSKREREILQWVALGKTQQDIGDILSISARTVEVHLRSSREKLFSITTAQAVARAVSLGLIEPR